MRRNLSAGWPGWTAKVATLIEEHVPIINDLSSPTGFNLIEMPTSAQNYKMVGRFPDIAYEFMETFARFEDGLKRSRFLKNKRNAEADWDAFARSLDKSFFEGVRKAPEAVTLVGIPPKILDNSLSWVDGEPVTDAVTLFRALRRARNNLFHGNKFIGDPAEDGRDKKLLMESLWVLNEAVSRHGKLRGTIKGP